MPSGIKNLTYSDEIWDRSGCTTEPLVADADSFREKLRRKSAEGDTGLFVLLAGILLGIGSTWFFACSKQAHAPLVWQAWTVRALDDLDGSRRRGVMGAFARPAKAEYPSSPTVNQPSIYRDHQQRGRIRSS